jgi:predicted transcriptional regulator
LKIEGYIIVQTASDIERMPFGPRYYTVAQTVDESWTKMVGNHKEKASAVQWFENCGYRAKKVVMEIEE